jgi:LmbE family N-acetylglucosaminyl deacetylase/CheY-like chemotaxis protein
MTGKRILLVEDDPDQAQLVRRWLEADGYAVEHAESGFAAAQLIESAARWDAVVSDINIPGPDGVEVLRLVKERLPHVPVLLVTAHADFDVAVRALKFRADDFLSKPLKRDELSAKLAALLVAAEQAQRAKRVVMAIGAHPDDVEIGVGGILIDHVAKGDRVVILTLTGGEAGGDTSERAKEAQRAAELIGATLELRNLPDRSVSEGAVTIGTIEQVIAAYGPDMIYTHTSKDMHQDHRNVHLATLVAARQVPNLFCYQAPSSTIEFRPNLYVEIADQLERKLEVLQAYRSQVEIRPYLTDSMIRSTAEYWGRFAHYRLVEPLEVVRSST